VSSDCRKFETVVGRLNFRADKADINANLKEIDFELGKGK
jgi:hypothetical protein